MKNKKFDVKYEMAQDTIDELEDIIVGQGNYNSECRKNDYGKAVGVLYQQQGSVRVHNGRIIGCDGAGYIVKHCSDASTGAPFKFNTFYFYNEKYFRTHNVGNKPHSHAFIDIAINNSKNAFCYYGRKEGSKSFDTHNGIFVSFTYKDPSTGNIITSNNFDVFLSRRYNPSSVIRIVYDHYIQYYDVKAHKTILKLERATAIDVKHFAEIPYK